MSDADPEITLADVEVPEELQIWIDRFPLPAGVPDADMNQAELAAGLSVSLPTINKWIKEPSFPIVQQGGLGKAYVFRLSHVHAWKMNKDAIDGARRSAAQEAIHKLQAAFANLDTEDPGAALTPKQRKEIAEADLQYSRAALARRQQVRLEDVVELLEDLMVVFRESAVTLADRLERELNLTPAQLETVKRAGHDMLTAAAERIEKEQLQERDVAFVDPSNQLVI